MTEDSRDPSGSDLFEASDGDQLTRRQIVYYGWHGGDVEETDGGFIVDGEKYSLVDRDNRT